MKAETYKTLLKDLQKLQKAIVASQITAVRTNATLSARMTRLHGEAEVGGRLDDFVATAARKSTVLFLLRTVFVRVLEDLGILGLKRIRGDWGYAAFREVAPALDHRAYFAFIFRDLAIDFSALFAPGDDELPLPDEDRCVDVWELWHHPNKDGDQYVWDGDGFDSRFLGDLYQDLDKDIRKRYALLQTPRFVEEYILDHTLTPALAEFDPATLREKGETFRLIDPTCGSGHFLIGAFHRLADYWRDRHGLNEWDACERALESVWGADINPHAIEIAQFRLLLEVVARTRETEISLLSQMEIHLRALDTLVPWEGPHGQLELPSASARLERYATAAQRAENAMFLMRPYHLVVGNPPYIQCKDDLKTDDYRAFWPFSAKGHYALSGPFFERFFQLGVEGAHVGFITAKAFASSEYGESLIANVLNRLDLRRLVDTSRITIPGHGTPTLLVFGRNAARTEDPVELLTVSRGELRRRPDPENGPVWRALSAVSASQPKLGYANFTKIERVQLDAYPWELADPLELEILGLVKAGSASLDDLATDFGYSFQTNCDEVFLLDGAQASRAGVSEWTRAVCAGESVRDYAVLDGGRIISPYREDCELMTELPPPLVRALWRWRTTLYGRVTFSGADYRASGRAWYQWHQFSTSKHDTSLSLVFSDVVTHNHFALDRGGRVFSRHSPVVKLKSQNLDDHLDLLGLLGSSVAAFWIRRTFRSKGAQGVGEGIKTEPWEQFVEPDSSKLGRFPVVSKHRAMRVHFARALDEYAAERAKCRPAAVLRTLSGGGDDVLDALRGAKRRYEEITWRMVALQEELDWIVYASYGLAEVWDELEVDQVEPLRPGHRAFEIMLARSEANAPVEERSAWWTRHGHDRVVDVPDTYSERQQVRLRARLRHIENDARIALLEAPTYKRRWESLDWDKETKSAAKSWLLDSLERIFASSNCELRPLRLEEVVARWRRDPVAGAVASLLGGPGAVAEFESIADELLRANALPDNPLRAYSEQGLVKVREWERVWALQDQEDAWSLASQAAASRGEACPAMQLREPSDPNILVPSMEVPRKFDKGDFATDEYFGTRGKRNVPRERFIWFADLSPPRFGWNGWKDRQRALVQVEAYTLAENDPNTPLPPPTAEDPRRCGVTIGLWESLPDVKRWGSPGEYEELLSLAQEACRQPRCPCPVLDAWKAKVLRGEADDDEKPIPLTTKGKSTKKHRAEAPAAAKPVDPAPNASLPERAWIAELLEAGKSIEVAGIWERHRRRLQEAERAAAVADGASRGQLPLVVGPAAEGKGQLRLVYSALPAEVRAIDEARLAVVLDDLVASGDLAVRGRGKKKRYQLVPRATRG